MQRATTETLYFETGPGNAPTLRIRPGETFEVQTQLNRGPWLDDHPDAISVHSTKAPRATTTLTYGRVSATSASSHGAHVSRSWTVGLLSGGAQRTAATIRAPSSC